MESKILYKNDFSVYKERLLNLYIRAFAKGKYAQYISEIEAEKDWQKYYEIGEIYVALHDKNLAGALVAYPLKFDENLPKQSVFDVEKSVYIAELMTESEFQGKGVATKLMSFFIENIDRNQYNDIAIRVWNENIPALSLYRKLGFEETGISVQQTKHRTANEKFTMNKMYLIKQLNS